MKRTALKTLETMEGKQTKFVTFNITGFKYRNYDFIQEVFKNNQVVFLQETWLYASQHKEISNVLPNSQYHAVSGMSDTDVGRVGRPYGGCAIVWHNSLALSCRPVATSSKRLCAVTAEAQGRAMLWVCVYMPVDDNSNASYAEYGDVLAEMSALLAQHDDHQLIIGGDFNVDINRPSRNLSLFIQFVNQENLIHVRPQTNDCYTFESAIGSRSSIDCFLISNSDTNRKIKFNVAEGGTNLSNHRPICIAIDFVIECIGDRNERTPITIIDWHKATDEHRLNYKNLLNHHLSNLRINEECLSCRDMMCKIHNNTILDLLDNISHIMSKCAWLAIPRRVIGRKHIAGWNDSVREYRDKAIFWHDIWKSCGRPVSGQITDLRKFTRAKYHWAVKQAKKASDKTIKTKTATSLMQNNFSCFWDTMKTLNSTRSTPVNVIDKVKGDQNIADLFKNNYSTLYNCLDDKELSEMQAVIEDDVLNKCAAGRCDSPNCHIITANMVAKAINKLNNHKNDEIYNLNTNNFIYADGNLFGLLSRIFQSMLTHGICNIKFYKSVINPIPKNKKKSKNDSSNYMAISLNTIFSKILDHILIDMLHDKLITSESQFAYKSEYSTTLCSFLVLETIQYYTNNGSNVYTLLMDATKAFDRVKYSKLFLILKERNICPLIMRLLLTLYLANTAVVKWNNKMSNSFKVANGVKQGGVASAHLFSVYIDPLIKSIKSSKLGCHIGGLVSNVFAYADDLIILCPTVSGLKKIIVICEEYSKNFELLFNPDKCYLLIFKSKDSPEVYCNVDIYISGEKVKILTKEVHLGNVLSTEGSAIDFQNVINDMKGRTVSIVNNFYNVSFKSKVALFNSQCTALYGSPLWDIYDDNIDRLNVTWRKCVRNLLSLHRRTKSYVLPYLMDTWNITDVIMERQILFYINLNNHSCDTIRNYFKNAMMSNTSYCVKNVNAFVNKFNVTLYDLFKCSKTNIKSLIRRSYPPMDWRAGMIEELLNAKDGISDLGLFSDEIDRILLDTCCDVG